jgi:hypothetical protein
MSAVIYARAGVDCKCGPSLQGSQYSAASSFQTGVSGACFSARSATSETRSQRLHLASSKSNPPLMALAMVGSACGSPGEGIAGPPAHMIAFQASHSSRSASRILASAAERISSR